MARADWLVKLRISRAIYNNSLFTINHLQRTNKDDKDLPPSNSRENGVRFASAKSEEIIQNNLFLVFIISLF